MTPIILNSVPVKATKKTIQSKNATFLRKALSSKNPYGVWETVNRILDPPKNQIKYDPRHLNRYILS